MAQGTQKTQYKCSRCGQTFDTAQELHDHEKNCQQDASSVDTISKSKETPSLEEAENDMRIEDRFEATDN